jgi:hypothetical protein
MNTKIFPEEREIILAFAKQGQFHNWSALFTWSLLSKLVNGYVGKASLIISILGNLIIVKNKLAEKFTIFKTYLYSCNHYFCITTNTKINLIYISSFFILASYLIFIIFSPKLSKRFDAGNVASGVMSEANPHQLKVISDQIIDWSKFWCDFIHTGQSQVVEKKHGVSQKEYDIIIDSARKAVAFNYNIQMSGLNINSQQSYIAPLMPIYFGVFDNCFPRIRAVAYILLFVGFSLLAIPSIQSISVIFLDVIEQLTAPELEKR